MLCPLPGFARVASYARGHGAAAIVVAPFPSRRSLPGILPSGMSAHPLATAAHVALTWHGGAGVDARRRGGVADDACAVRIRRGLPPGGGGWQLLSEGRFLEAAWVNPAAPLLPDVPQKQQDLLSMDAEEV